MKELFSLIIDYFNILMLIVVFSYCYFYNRPRGDKVEKNQIGNSNLYVSALGLGCMSLGTNEHQAKEIIDRALDLGINYLDTADLYDQTRNESIVGKALKGKRDQVILATKVGNHLQSDGSWFWDPSKHYIKEQVKSSLLRLNTDYIDLYQLHGGTKEDPILETIEAFEELKKEGFIRYYGISSIRPNVIRKYVEHGSIVSVMMQYNLLDRRPEESILDLLHENEISVVVRGALAKGLLTDNTKRALFNKGPKGYLDYTTIELENIIKQLYAHELIEESLTTTALHYVLKHPAVASTLVGVSSIDQLEENVKAYAQSATITDNVYKQLQKLTKDSIYLNHR